MTGVVEALGVHKTRQLTKERSDKRISKQLGKLTHHEPVLRLTTRHSHSSPTMSTSPQEQHRGQWLIAGDEHPPWAGTELPAPHKSLDQPSSQSGLIACERNKCAKEEEKKYVRIIFINVSGYRYYIILSPIKRENRVPHTC